MKQVIIARKDLGMSPGKLAAQVSHASMAFLSRMIRTHSRMQPMETGADGAADYKFRCEMDIDKDLYEGWLSGIFKKVVCEAKNRNAIDKAVRIATELGLEENRDFFLIKDCCLTELTPEEVDENGTGWTLTCLGFRPLPDEIANQISKKFQLFK